MLMCDVRYRLKGKEASRDILHRLHLRQPSLRTRCRASSSHRLSSILLRLTMATAQAQTGRVAWQISMLRCVLSHTSKPGSGAMLTERTRSVLHRYNPSKTGSVSSTGTCRGYPRCTRARSTPWTTRSKTTQCSTNLWARLGL